MSPHLAKAVAKSVASLVAEDGEALVPLRPDLPGDSVVGALVVEVAVDRRGIEKGVKVLLWDHRNDEHVLAGNACISATHARIALMHMEPVNAV